MQSSIPKRKNEAKQNKTCESSQEAAVTVVLECAFLCKILS